MSFGIKSKKQKMFLGMKEAGKTGSKGMQGSPVAPPKMPAGPMGQLGIQSPHVPDAPGAAGLGGPVQGTPRRGPRKFRRTSATRVGNDAFNPEDNEE